MNKPRRNGITLLQYILGVNVTQIGTSILTLPSELAKMATTDGWISIVVGWMIATIVSLCIIGVMAKHPGATIYDVLTHYLGKWFGGAWIIILMCSSLFIAMIVFYEVLRLIKLFILPNTSSGLLAIFFMIPTYMVLRSGIRIFARYAEFVFFFTLWLPILLLVPLKDAEFIFMLPVLKEGMLPILHAVAPAVISFIGFEIAFILYPYLKNKQAAARGIVIANTITLLVYLQITLSCFLYFSPDEITNLLWPTLTLVKPIHFPFFERFEILFLSFYMFIFSTSFLPSIFIVTENINQFFGKQNWQLPICILLSLILAASFVYIPTHSQLEVMSKWWNWDAYIVFCFFPVLFFLYATLYTRWKQRKTV
ncbi:endospore germination permease [Aneurinibacillus aneurinilyticus]|nr:endospore germination permease [Aneurinibacillus aneurinilyticus]MED0705644.1 endospore germination permease [Aneurinibacillus aneurinilyticus]MED0724165.1 endospore germination permease [Aneurinibacillus aneurinilyticus]MED0735082.1 endospore germination permease [Aneurinibacillus aneurinilyticus]MED0743289.1 endospore germination permease [Aneurinibacillus aneurinilyticus]